MKVVKSFIFTNKTALCLWCLAPALVRAQETYEPYTFGILADKVGVSYRNGGFYFPMGIAVDKAGTVYVANTYNYTV